MEYKPTIKETEYLERQNQKVEQRANNQNQSPGILIEQHARSNPEGSALFWKKSSWSWNALNQESNKIANYFSQNRE